VRTLTADSPPFAGLTLSAVGHRQAHARIEAWLAEAIGEGVLRDGDRLPAEQDLAQVFGVSRMTLRQALAALEARALVERRRGRQGGTFVRRSRVDIDLTGLAGFSEQMRRARVRASARVLAADRVPAPPEVADALRLARSAQAYLVDRVRLADGVPLALERTWLPADLLPGLLDRPLTGSLYELMAHRYDVVPDTASEWLDAVVADDEQAALLDVGPGAALLRITRTTYDPSGLPVEHAVDLYRPDRARITVRTGVAGAGRD
jgi:GntR family transcriptional regulator